MLHYCLFSNIDNLMSFISYSCDYCSQMAYVQIILWPFFSIHNFLELKSCETKVQYEAMIYIFSFSSGKNVYVIRRAAMIRNWKNVNPWSKSIFLTPSLFMKMMYCNTLWSDVSTKISQKPIKILSTLLKNKKRSHLECLFFQPMRMISSKAPFFTYTKTKIVFNTKINQCTKNQHHWIQNNSLLDKTL